MCLRRGLFGPWGRVARAIRRAICKGPRPTDSSTYWQCSPAKRGDWDSPNEGFVQGWLNVPPPWLNVQAQTAKTRLSRAVGCMLAGRGGPGAVWLVCFDQLWS